MSNLSGTKITLSNAMNTLNCPVCGSNSLDVIGITPSDDDRQIVREVSCDTCSSEWSEVFQMDCIVIEKDNHNG